MSGFNSIVVRLKVRMAVDEWLAKQRFNSIVVRLKGWAMTDKARARNGFNSIVVRLKAAEILKASRQSYKFQFHSGSIKRQIAAQRCCKPSELMVSIP